MHENRDQIKICLTETAITVLGKLNLSKEKYFSFPKGLPLFNMGPEIKLKGWDGKYDLNNNSALIPTGLRVIVPPGYELVCVNKSTIVNSGLVIRNGPVIMQENGELYINVINIADKDTVIPVGIELPMSLLFVPIDNNVAILNYEDYISQLLNKQTDAD